MCCHPLRLGVLRSVNTTTTTSFEVRSSGGGGRGGLVFQEGGLNGKLEVSGGRDEGVEVGDVVVAVHEVEQLGEGESEGGHKKERK